MRISIQERQGDRGACKYRDFIITWLQRALESRLPAGILFCIVAERSSALDTSFGVFDLQSVGSSPGLDTWMRHKAVGVCVCCVMHIKEPSTSA